MRPLLLSLVLLAAPAAQAAPALQKNGVTLELSVEETGTDALRIVGKFTPDPRDPPLHLYSVDLKEGDVGFPTRIDLAPGEKATVAGPLKADVRAHDQEGTPVYPPGPVTLTLPIKPAAGSGPDTAVRLLITYMACTDRSCLVPVIRTPVSLTLGGVATKTVTPPPVPVTAPEIAPAGPPPDAAALAKIVAEEVGRALDRRRESGIRWRRPGNVPELERIIRDGAEENRRVLLDFTGPSCVNCQQMAKTVFRDPDVRAGWNAGIPVEVDTDPPHDDFAEWQQQKYLTQNRPFYVVISPDGHVEKWNTVFSTDDRVTMRQFVSFLSGGPGSDSAANTGGIWQFFLLAILGGLFTLVMPCTYPMIPLTLNVFAKQSREGRPLVPLAAAYAIGIVVAFTGLGVIVTGVFGASLSTLAGHPITNLVVGLAFVILGMSLLDVFFLNLPGGLTNAVGGARGGYIGALVMGLTFAVTAFTCTAPFAGTVLAEGVATGNWAMPVLGMAVYSGTIAVPFFAMGVAPSFLKKLPKADSWMHEFKVVGGLIEIGAAAKFLAICDVAWGWGFVRRGPVVAMWTAIALISGVYVAGWLRMHDDKPVEHVGPWRLMLSLAFVTLAFWLLHGLAGGNLGVVESFFPGDEAP